jgi:hypothetical protein
MDWDKVKDRLLMWFYILAGIAIGFGTIVAVSIVFEELNTKATSKNTPYTIYCREADYFFVAHSSDTPLPMGAWLRYTDIDTKTYSFVGGSCAAVKE